MTEKERLRLIAKARARAAASKSDSSPTVASVAGNFGAGSQTGIARGLGFPVDAVSGAISGLGELTGAWGPIEHPIGGSESIGRLLEPFRAGVRDPQNAWERGARRVGEEVGASAAMAPLGLATAAGRAAPVAFAATEAGSALGSGTGAAIANEIAPDSVTAEIIGQLAGGLAGGSLVGRRFDTKPVDQLRANDVSKDDLIAQAGRLYDDAAAQGITAQQQATQGLADDIRNIASGEGLISPTGRIAESYPRIRDAINMVDDFAQGSMDPGQMQAVRRTFQNAAKSADGAERRIGTMMLKKFDDFVEPLAPEFRQANKLYRRAMLGDVVDTANDLAEARASQFSGSGMENARRTEYRKLDRDIIKGKLKGLSDDQSAALTRVARGGTAENIARGAGRAAPTGVVSAALGGGMPFLVGNALGGPMLGTSLGVGAMTAGGIGRKMADRMGQRNAEIAELLMRSADGAMPKLSGPQMSRVAAALLGLRASATE